MPSSEEARRERLRERLRQGFLERMEARRRRLAQRLRELEASKLAEGVKAGLSASTAVYEVASYRYPHASTKDALYGDWKRIGADFRKVIERASEETKDKS